MAVISAIFTRSPRRWQVRRECAPVAMLALALILTLIAPSPVAISQTNYEAIGRSKFQAQKYDEAIEAYRKHLRRVPRDYNAWNQIGAAYYHTGLPRRGLRYLKHVERKTAEKSYNYYYQGLCYTAIGYNRKAKEYFAYAASRFTDEYASRATFEMAAIEYNEKNRERARYWATLYLSRYPAGVYRAQAQRLLSSLSTGRWLDDVTGVEKPDMEKALFKYNRLSLHPEPHYWFFQSGWQYVAQEAKEPEQKGGIKTSPSVFMGAILNGGIGIGPWRKDDMTAFGGYTYRQLWITDTDRLQEFLGDFDVAYFPLRTDLLERRHQFYGDFRRQFGGQFFWGVFGRYEFARIGSELGILNTPDDAELRKVLKISDTQLLIPWVGASYAGNMRTLLYFYLRKELNEDSPEHSNQSYSFGLSGGDGKPVLSLGISHDMEFPEEQLTVAAEIFRYEFIYNDYWLDYTREGILVSAEHELVPRWYVNGTVGYYQDAYLLPRIKLGSCSAKPTLPGATTNNAGGNERPVTCTRNDTGFLIQGGIYWNWSQFTRLSATLQIVQNTNPEQQEFDEQKTTALFTYTMAFPSVARVTRFVDRYADTAFTKEAE